MAHDHVCFQILEPIRTHTKILETTLGSLKLAVDSLMRGQSSNINETGIEYTCLNLTVAILMDVYPCLLCHIAQRVWMLEGNTTLLCQVHIWHRIAISFKIASSTKLAQT